LTAFRILGPLEVEGAGALGGPRPRALLLTLLLAPNQSVSRERLIDAVWPEDPPETARHALHVYLSTLRKAIGPDRILTEPAGYRIAVTEDELDALQFRHRLRDGDLTRALALWRGPIESADPAAAELEALRLKALEDRLDGELQQGRHTEAIPQLERLTREHPHRERPHAQLMLALYRADRQADALAAYQTARRALDDLGLTPGEELRALELAILHRDPSLQPRRKHRLPAPATPLIGRRRQVEEVSELLSGEARLVTLVGPGGTGKTRIALQVASELAFPDGAVFVDLAPLRDAALVEAQIATAVGEELESLRDRAMLLVLDNFEQVDEAAPLVGRLLRDAPGLRCLVTSRSRLRIYGEHGYEVGPLELWDEAVPLFIARARAAGSRLEAGEDVAQLCEALDRLPLALELVAARADDRRGLLAIEGPRDLPARQQTLQAAIAWSVDLLDGKLRERFHALAAFAGGWDEQAAAAVAGATSADLAALIARSLVRRDRERYAMLETIREYAAGRLDDSTRERHADHYRALAERADEALRAGGDQALWLGRLDREHGNLRAALDHRPGDVRLAGALAAFWNVRGHAAEGLDRLRRALAHEAPLAPRAKALAGASGLAWARGDHERSQELAEAALDLYRTMGDAAGMVKALANLGYAASATGALDAARAHYEEALAVAEQPRDKVVALNCLGDLALRTRDLARAQELCERARVESVDEESAAVAVFNLGYAELLDDRRAQAAAHLRAAAREFAALGDEETVALALDGLALALADRPDAAARLLGAADARRAAVGGAVSFEDELRARGAAEIRARASSEAYAQGATVPLEELLDENLPRMGS
jgi:predicted ATPase/DNA-binding SARP family transcriptional activator